MFCNFKDYFEIFSKNIFIIFIFLNFSIMHKYNIEHKDFYLNMKTFEYFDKTLIILLKITKIFHLFIIYFQIFL